MRSILTRLARLMHIGRRPVREDPPAGTPSGQRRPGEMAPAISITPARTQARLQRAFAAAVAGTAGSADADADVVWVDGDNELLVRPAKTRVVLKTGFVLVGITVYTEQTKDVEIVVPFAVGAPDDPLGLTVATESIARGPAPIVETWSGPLIAAAWDALLRVGADVAATAGVDEDNQPLLPIALVADEKGLAVTPQARHTFDRLPR